MRLDHVEERTGDSEMKLVTTGSAFKILHQRMGEERWGVGLSEIYRGRGLRIFKTQWSGSQEREREMRERDPDDDAEMCESSRLRGER